MWAWTVFFYTSKSNKSPVKADSFRSTDKYNKSYYSWREIEGTDRAHGLQLKIFCTSVKYYQNILSNNQIVNTRVIANDINKVETIYVTRVAILKG